MLVAWAVHEPFGCWSGDDAVLCCAVLCCWLPVVMVMGCLGMRKLGEVHWQCQWAGRH